ncbi:uncharacterized protein LOC120702639 isoform X2 [Panicum virgatum]|uniref:Uncharacterized protein n=2 Tax=Panicum virgatum TaxID=38727 RepID=A0A8T0XI70_PANVG|nr:uncharacterized protein LOC120702639 isoform X2 [Panicum virgatum]XP_039842458.1 uncharacterized protein LOC120702639 isoform X2 [Panicum virgatum]KAG2658628.1 hypothetical protein PVAP13_1KG290000 [Panicum virgatum]KAG2658629.1 hypothetical protein PVAP13_1KG290000 [Panicum virgatum]
MLREDAAELTVTGGASAAATKIRKRCAVSPSGASPDRQRRTLRLKRGVRLVGHRKGGGAGTGASPCASSGRERRMSESSWNRHGRHGHADVETRSAASARKLVSALWQLNKGDEGVFEEEEEIGWDAAAARRCSDQQRSASLEFSKISRRKSKTMKDDEEQRSWHNGHAHGQWFSDVMSNGGTVEVRTCPQGRTPARPGGDGAALAQDLCHSLTASAELVRVLANVLGPAGALGPTAASLLAALRSELDAARGRARRLARRHHGGGEEEEHHHRLRRQLAEEVRAWKARHREKAAAAARLVASELDGERRSRRRAERVGRKLAEALADAEASLRAATRELERERAARARLEKVCDELARDVGGAVAEEEEEELRRDAAREELEREREMLQLADELREERVRMKLAEARIQFEEKNAAVDRLRQELEAFLGTSSSKEDRQESPFHGEGQHTADDHRSLQLVLASEFGVDGIDRVVTDKTTGQGENGNDDGEGDGGSEGSDIELHMDGNSWSYKTTSRATTAKNAASVHGSLSDRGTECGARSQGTGDALELQEWDDVRSDDGASTKDLDEDAERYEAIKNLREQMLAGHGFVFLSQGGEADADGDRHRQGLVPRVEDGGLW